MSRSVVGALPKPPGEERTASVRYCSVSIRFHYKLSRWKKLQFPWNSLPQVPKQMRKNNRKAVFVQVIEMAMGQSDSSKPSLFYLRGMAQKHCNKSAYACAFQHGSTNPAPALYLLQAEMTSIEGLLAFWLLVRVHYEIWAMDQEGNTNSLLSIAKLRLGSEWIKCMLLSHCYQADRKRTETQLPVS